MGTGITVLRGTRTGPATITDAAHLAAAVTVKAEGLYFDRSPVAALGIADPTGRARVSRYHDDGVLDRVGPNDAFGPF